MITLLIINLACLLVIGIFFSSRLSLLGKDMFADMTKLYKWIIIISPSILLTINIIYSILINRNLLLVGLYPAIIPSIYFFYTFYDSHFNKKKFLKVSVLKDEISCQLKKQGLSISAEDIRIRILPRNRIDIIVNIYNPNEYDYLKKLLGYMGNFFHSDKRFKRLTFKFYVDLKKKSEMIPILT
ncbi:hypothetical protein COJ87_19890 [Bacillus cereus]|uniref:hypothetical protein n=1 Tax=Bacillus cereus TaxID=1396 RepID=UPI000BEC2C3A|nr:hypothetical protein [Bacillus cereus]PEC89401.1 hypothetical protein CON02_20185 [Bacillus cereus]PFO03474.1 hypothetical protein COJ68_01645 [Bacillus cereus]PFO75283.1 hypothetical protein COJ87_19890 [Bacillus cereus]PGN75018.1 hypothetical protein CN963_28235 [Bacillus cereus]